MTPAVSIIIPAFGHEGLTRACVESVLASTAAAEVIVVDDASPEPIALSDLAGTSVLRSERNLGFSGACNHGAHASSGDVLVFLNNDTRVQGDWLQEMLDQLEPDVGVVGARLLYEDGTAQHAGMVFSEADGAPRHVYRGFPGDHPAVTRCRDMQAVTGACLMVRRGDFLPDGFDEAFENGFEDVDLCLRARSAGRRVAYCGTTAVTHLESVSVRDDKAADEERHDRNRSRFTERWGQAVIRDEIATYIADGLIEIQADDVYPLRIRISPLLATCVAEDATGDLADLLTTRSRQVFDLQKHVGAVRAENLDLRYRR